MLVITWEDLWFEQQEDDPFAEQKINFLSETK